MSTASQHDEHPEDGVRGKLEDGLLVDAVTRLSDDDLEDYRRRLRADISRQGVSAAAKNVYRSPQYRAYRLTRHLQIAEEETAQRKGAR